MVTNFPTRKTTILMWMCMNFSLQHKAKYHFGIRTLPGNLNLILYNIHITFIYSKKLARYYVHPPIHKTIIVVVDLVLLLTQPYSDQSIFQSLNLQAQCQVEHHISEERNVHISFQNDIIISYNKVAAI